MNSQEINSMKDVMLQPCPRWAEKLAARHQDDLNFSELVALNQHLASCQKCAAIHLAYRVMETRIYYLPAVEPLAVLPSHLLHQSKQPPLLHTLDARMGVAISSLRLKLSGLLATLFAHFPRGPIYGNAGNAQFYC